MGRRIEVFLHESIKDIISKEDKENPQCRFGTLALLPSQGELTIGDMIDYIRHSVFRVKALKQSLDYFLLLNGKALLSHQPNGLINEGDEIWLACRAIPPKKRLRSDESTIEETSSLKKRKQSSDFRIDEEGGREVKDKKKKGSR
eukprot:Gregarina_sp_Poly_1__2393@NODE_1640_length_3646_cov_139_268231_g1081_i0_p3_GENE_NODE_1640_length_3646_cov_139_268231_g1081_i0NODE_1640_length_3646_cov_139_268231_g1081_i0_p3_ORF_typecomplete_len145_score22_97_NODE_1640_length_3646_cov_139_268231_g1081_i027461